MSENAHRLELGDIRCTALRGANDNPTLPLVNLLLPPHGDETKRPPSEKTAVLHGQHSCLLVEMAGRRILIDGSLDSTVVRAGLCEAGVAADEIDLVLITHGDTDHIAGLVDAEHCLIYPNARFVLHCGLWEAWISDGERGDPDPFYAEEQRLIGRALAEQIAGRVTLIDADAEIGPGIRALASPGHRPSHLAYELADGSHTLLNMGDAAIAPVLVEQHTRGNAFDSDFATGIRSRRTLLERAAQAGTLTFVPHFPWPGFVRITQRADQFDWTQAEPQRED